MKAYFVALLALPAVLAAPAASATFPTTFPFETMKCTCTNNAGDTTAASCLYMGGEIQGPGEYCYPAVAWARDMGKTFTDAYCARNDPAMPKAKCTPILMCKNTLVNDPQYYQPC